MLKRLTANQDCFKPIEFKENSLNLIIATKHDKSAPTASRNGLGKSTFVNVVAFCLGLDVDTKRDLPLDELQEWAWTLTFTNGKKDFTVTRGASKPDIVSVKGDLTGCPVIGKQEAILGEGIVISYKVEEWQKVLRWIFFGLKPAAGNDDDGDRAPDYQSLMSRFVRKDFDDPIRVRSNDKITTSEMAITYLLGLDWQFLAGAKEVRKMKTEADALMSVAKAEIAQYNKDRAALRAECDRIEQELADAEKALADFNTIPHAKIVEDNLYEYAIKIAELDRKIVVKSRLLSAARETKSAGLVPIAPMEKFYGELGLAFSDGAKRTLEQVRDFHLKLTVNRESLIEKQIALLERELEDLRRVRNEVNAKRMEVAESIKAKAALEDYHRRTADLAAQREELQKKREGLNLHDRGEEIKEKADERRMELISTAKETLKQLRAKIAVEERFYKNVIDRLYADAIPDGSPTETTLGIEIREDKANFGISYRPQFWGDRSGGKNKLKTFAFDLTILNEQQSLGSSVRFMVHDSVLYESSDPRQQANALKLVAELCEKKGLQYVCAINSDDITDSDFSGIFPKKKLEKYVVRELDDAPSGMNKFLGMHYPVRLELPKEDQE